MLRGRSRLLQSLGNEEIKEITLELTRKQKQSLMIAPISRLEMATHDLSFLAPDIAIAVRTAHNILLEVDRAEERIAGDSNGENQRSSQRRELHWITREVLRLERVHGREPHG